MSAAIRINLDAFLNYGFAEGYDQGPRGMASIMLPGNAAAVLTLPSARAPVLWIRRPSAGPGVS